MVSVKAATAIAKKQLALRDQLWPQAESVIWNRKANKGFATIPKTMPMILRIMDELGNGTRLSETYMTLWCSTWDNSFASLAKQRDLAVAAGFSGSRAEYTWRTRAKKLADLLFIDIKGGKSGPMSLALIHNPHLVIRWHYEQRTPGLLEDSYNALVEWALDLGAKDMTESPSKAMDTFRKVAGGDA
ncbi:hypothetical protein [Methyloceanibacter sp. wino2]|uniref:hypothetical protein n=1 Tax=Methyloceanibacter sp. wino2 TaxID=2170729 RepID=UPI001ABB7CE9|nr:hypothetical protein [Methyloceanibacter sp. wino2]